MEKKIISNDRMWLSDARQYGAQETEYGAQETEQARKEEQRFNVKKINNIDSILSLSKNRATQRIRDRATERRRSQVDRSGALLALRLAFPLARGYQLISLGRSLWASCRSPSFILFFLAGY